VEQRFLREEVLQHVDEEDEQRFYAARAEKYFRHYANHVTCALTHPTEAVMSTPTIPHDAMRELASQIYVGLVTSAYGDTGSREGARPQPEALARMSFKLAEAFHAADSAVNPVTIAAAAATKSAAPFDAGDLDLGSLHTRR